MICEYLILIVTYGAILLTFNHPELQIVIGISGILALLAIISSNMKGGAE